MSRALILLLLAMMLLTAGCSTLVSKASDRFARNLGAAVLDSDDPSTVRDGLPAYLLLLDGLIQGQTPGKASNAPMLFAAAQLNGAYAGSFAGDDAIHARRLAGKAFAYARRGICLRDSLLCQALEQDQDHFDAALAQCNDVEAIYALASAWAGYLQTNSEDMTAIAGLPRIEALFERVTVLDPGHDQGQVYVFLGVLNSLRPEAVGGKPELGRMYFEKAIALSGGRNLYAKALMAQYYARLVYDQQLHDRLLAEVLAADPKAPGLTLTNTLAQSLAGKLMESGKDYF